MTRQRLLLIVLLAWALAMIVPDVLRVVQPLGSFGFYADNDGLIYDITGPFDAESDSPAWQAGIRDGDKLALSKLRCFPYTRTTCRQRTHGARRTSARAAGARGDVRAQGDQRPSGAADHPEGSAGAGQPIRALHRPHGSDRRDPGRGRGGLARLDASRGHELGLLPLRDLVQSRASLRLLCAPCSNGRLLLLAQNLASAIAEAVGYVGLILFVLRAPDNEPDRKWRWLERMLPVIGAVLALLMLFTYGNLTGYRTETGTRFAILTGFVVAVCAVGYPP